MHLQLSLSNWGPDDLAERHGMRCASFPLWLRAQLAVELQAKEMLSSCQMKESGSIYLRCGCWHLRDERPDHAKLCGLRGRSLQAASAPTSSFVYAYAALGLSLSPGWQRHRARRRCRRVKQERQESLQVWFEEILNFLKVVEEMTLEEIGCLPARQALKHLWRPAGKSHERSRVPVSTTS